jgi:hypothetical protein
MAATDVVDDVENVQVVPVLSSEQSEHFSPSRDHGPLLCHHTWTFLKGQKA